jgi:hypothetical protein
VNVVDSWIETSFMAQLLIGVNVEKFSKMKACGRVAACFPDVERSSRFVLSESHESKTDVCC